VKQRISIALVAALIVAASATACGPPPEARIPTRVATYIWNAARTWLSTGPHVGQPTPNFTHLKLAHVLVVDPSTFRQRDINCTVIIEPAVTVFGRYKGKFAAVDAFAWTFPDAWFLACFPPGRGVGPGAYTAPAIKITRAANAPGQTPVFECVIWAAPKVGSLGRGDCDYVGPSAPYSTNRTVWDRGYVQVV
jgi:hypothetical protein